ncbi:galactose-3-O-sulfotransferase 2-like [Artemia franciscana]|uniref:galactose-3-O-sulfotransferase 2-like n=1 Tax=Artemia franciscana TaxID=6661 RepID=UPI0032DBA735
MSFETFVEDERWNFTIADELLGSEALYIIILRDPVYQFESMCNFFDLREFYNVSSFDGFIERLEYGTLREDRFLNIAGRNQLSFMLGLQPESFSNEIVIEEFSSYISTKFHLVMMSEYFDESITLLRNLLRSQIGHMLYVPKLTRTNDSKQNLTKK